MNSEQLTEILKAAFPEAEVAVMAAAAKYEPVSIRSATTAYSQPCSFSTPVTTKVSVSNPSIFAPIAINIFARSVISGSRAALRIVVTPSANAAAIQCCLMIKSLFRLSLRMVTGFVQSLIKLCGLNWIAPDYTTLCRRQKHIDIVISYQKSSDGLHLLMDSTGMKFLGEGEWKRKKHGPEYRRQWRKLHIGIDAKTLYR
jgi:hypothetical protein